ncbi:hypothetical protein B0H11DRAFT_1302135 [Mycena galericulata]|nr:hypothetical protein B0H11DRAFT_1302135 [Mycena galericulata]
MSTDNRTHPCLREGPLPASVQQPGLTVEIRYFQQESQMQDYPYDIMPSPGGTGKAGSIECYYVPFYQISGIGPPPADLTGSHPGDVYIDLSPAQHALYGRLADESWKRWFDPQPWDKTEENSVRHPHFRTRKLWCSSARGISWFTANTVRNNQDRAREQKLVSPNVHKDEETRWREAGGLVSAALAQEQKEEPKAMQSASTAHRRRRSTSYCSPPFDSRPPSPAPVLGKRKRSTAFLGRPSNPRALLEGAIKTLNEETAELAAKISALEARPAEAASQDFAAWIETVVRDGLAAQKLSVKNQLGSSGLRYLELSAELAAVEAQLAQEQSKYNDAQTALSVAVSEDEQCIRQFDLATSQLGSTFGWA